VTCLFQFASITVLVHIALVTTASSSTTVLNSITDYIQNNQAGEADHFGGCSSGVAMSLLKMHKPQGNAYTFSR